MRAYRKGNSSKGLFLCIGLLSLAMPSCTPPPKVSEETISKAISKESVIALDLNRLTTESWKKGYIFGPYVPKEMIRQATGCPIHFSPSTLVTEGNNLVILTKKKSVICYAEISRSYGDVTEKRDSVYTPNSSIVILTPVNFDSSSQQKTEE